VALTVGDPAGIGPEIVRRAVDDPRVLEVCEPLIYGPADAASLRAFPAGVLSAAAGRTSYDAVVAAVDAALDGRIDAIATAPVNKEAFALAGLPWKGHTDLLGALTGASRAVMMFDSPTLRVSLATVHIPLSEVPAALTMAVVEETIRITAASLPDFGVAAPRLAVAGLNPHAGEHGLMGREDEQVIAPVIAACVRDGLDVTGPIPGDTVFLRASRGEFDAVVACYHDQGLIPVKLLSFGRSVNVTLGLPIVRTSVDHGTAFDIAGEGRADASSMIEAVLLAARLARARRSSAATRSRLEGVAEEVGSRGAGARSPEPGA
jgi:4-hydroxythreonine-4-phosphate dehydrogenase